jgi:CRP/FNR family transcriptional regulator, dissimilatory nitrate respiration regulator
MPTMMDDKARANAPQSDRRPAIKVDAFLARLPLFSELDPDHLARMAAGTHSVRIAKGEAVFHRGDACNGFHVVVYGQVKLAFTSPQGSEKVIEIVGPGRSFGEALMFLESPYIVSAHALADTMLLHVSKHAVFGELEREPRFARKMLSGLSLRLHGLVHDVEAYSLRSSVERVIGFLLSACADGARGDAKREKVTLSAGKSVIASRLNMTPEHFSRVLHDLSAVGLIEVEGKSVLIPDLGRLREHRA